MNEEIYIDTVAAFTKAPKQSVIKFKDLGRKIISEGWANTMFTAPEGQAVV